MNRLPRFFIPLLLFIFTVCAPPAHADNLQRLLRSSSKQLHSYADDYTLRYLPDSALLCYTIVAERYNPKMSYADKLITYKALLGRWNINFSWLGNYSEAAEDLVAANRLQQESNLPDTRLIYAKGVSDMALAAQDGDMARLSKSYDKMKAAYWKAFEEKDEETRFKAIYNMVNYVDISGDMSLMSKEMNSLKSHPFANPNLNKLVRLNYEASKANSLHNYTESINAYRNIFELQLPQKYVSFGINVRTKLAQVLMHIKRYAEADRVLDEALKIPENVSPSQRLAIFWLKRICADSAGDHERSLQLYSDYLELKDSLQSYNLTMSLDHMQFTEQLRSINAEKEKLKQQKRAQTMMLVIALLVIVAGAIIIWLVVRTNSRLRDARDVMYRRVHELNQYQQALTATDTRPASDDTQQKSRNQIPEEMQQKISTEILRVIASEEIYSPEFSLERLAELAGCRPRIASQIINSRFRCNFWSLINEARIREACRRIDDTERYGDYSTEAIAESVGFNSRSSFCAAFKKFTGLGVGEYRRMSRKRAQQQSSDS